jgi:hypothetical protein
MSPLYRMNSPSLYHIFQLLFSDACRNCGLIFVISLRRPTYIFRIFFIYVTYLFEFVCLCLNYVLIYFCVCQLFVYFLLTISLRRPLFVSKQACYHTLLTAGPLSERHTTGTVSVTGTPAVHLSLYEFR